MSTAGELAPVLRAAFLEAAPAPVALRGRTSAGKTSLLRRLAGDCRVEPVFRSAFDLTAEIADAMRSGRFDRYSSELASDERPLVVEHLEDLRGKAATRDVLRRLLQSREEQGHATLLTLTNATGDAEVIEWLHAWAEVFVLG
jgi:ATPase subunit of ABC transporter with duplicated ATPase domains